MIDSPVVTRLNYEREGKQVAELRVPRTSNTSGWSQLFIPIVCVKNGDGPTVLVTGGNHGDEPEGQIAALKLAREIEPSDVSGRIIMIPCLSPEASMAGTRNWPSGENFNRVFPGSPTGTPAEVLADYLTRVVFPLTDAVIDIHSGGRSLMCLPWSEMHLVAEQSQRRAMADMMLAWNADWSVVYIDIAGGGLLVSEAESQGKPVIGTELGGGGHVTAPIHRLAADGLHNVLRHLGVLRGRVTTRAELGLPETVILKAVELENYVLAPSAGLWETVVELGQEVISGQVVGRIHRLDIATPPVEVCAQTSGLVCTIRAIAATDQGDAVVTIGQRCARSELC